TPVPIGLSGPNQDALARGFPNLEQHIANVKTHGIPVVVAINAFKDDPASELEWLRQQACRAGAAEAAVSTHHADGGKGSEDLARAVIRAAASPSSFSHLYDLAWPTKRKIETIAMKMYGASGVSFDPQAEQDMDLARQLGYEALPICMAKTPLSLARPRPQGPPKGIHLADQRSATARRRRISHGRLFGDSVDARAAEKTGGGADRPGCEDGPDRGPILVVHRCLR